MLWRLGTHNLPSATKQPRIADQVNQSEFSALKTRAADGVNPSTRAGGAAMRCPRSPAKQEKEVHSPPCTLSSIQAPLG